MKTKISLDRTWNLCDEMWKWIKREKQTYSLKSVPELKGEYLIEEGTSNLEGNCYFCEYSGEKCDNCPGKEIDSDFACNSPDYNYYTKPIEFSNKISEMKKLRDNKKGMKK